jgi:hypothetical protein
MPKSRRVIVALPTDEHAGHVLGLCSPDVELKRERPDRTIEKYTPKLTATQEWLWEAWTEDIRGLKQLAGKDEIVVFDLGDPVQGNAFPRELVSTRQADHYAIAEANKIPLLSMNNVRRAFFVKGTGVHEFGEGSAQSVLANALQAKLGKQIDVMYHAEAALDGFVMDLAHHGPPPGVRNWLRGNILRLYAQSIMDDCLKSEKQPPNFLGRGHYHQFVTEVVTRQNAKTWECRATICPAYCLIDDYARKVAKSPYRATVGMIALEIVGGRLVQQHEFIRTIDFRTRLEL